MNTPAASPRRPGLHPDGPRAYRDADPARPRSGHRTARRRRAAGRVRHRGHVGPCGTVRGRRACPGEGVTGWVALLREVERPPEAAQ